MRRWRSCLIWLIIAGSAAALFLAWQYAGFRVARRTLPAGMSMAGLPVEGMTREQALNALELAFATPVEVTYLDQRFILPPESVAFHYDVEQTAANLEQILKERAGLSGFIAYVLRRPEEKIVVPVAASYSAQRLDDFLARVATQYDRPPRPLVPLPTSLTFRAAGPGTRLDREISRARLAAALLSAAERRVALAVHTEPPPPHSLDALELMLKVILEKHPGLVAGIFVKDLQNGDELGINADIAYSGMSVLKIAIIADVYRVLEMPLTPEVSAWISQTIGATDSNAAANLLLGKVLGNGDGYQGAENLSASLRYLGLVNTFIAAPY
ncbi:MAG: peptidoglycan binding domain-containing protein, partial [Anaerolineae bacterium]|nr:peptidoglycan binding domain-containing protein [Anaerolineae bacterium]